MSVWHLAQLNVAELLAPIDSPQLTDFVANLDRINALAEAAPGFVWRLLDDVSDNATTLAHDFGDDYIVNLSVWENVEVLHDYVYRSAHKDIMRRKKEWFQRMTRAHMVLWWVPASTTPSVGEAEQKLRHLQVNGPTDQAFTFRQAFINPDDAATAANAIHVEAARP